MEQKPTHFRNSQDFYGILYYRQLKSLYPYLHSKDENTMLQYPEALRTYWANHKEEWFSHKTIENWTMSLSEVYKNTYEQNISLILQYDQLNRHPPHSPDRQKQLQHKFASMMALQMLHSENYAQLPIHERIFILLTLRHNKNLNLKYYVLKKVKAELSKCENNDPQWLRFYGATIQDISNYKSQTKYYKKEELTKEPHEYLLQATQIIEPPKYKNVSSKEIQNSTQTMLDAMEKLILSQNKDTIAVSISGGVDSNVCAYIAKQVCEKHNLKLKLLHVCYNNRGEENSKEKELLKYYAKRLGLPLYIRSIDEITRIRKPEFRKLYETITRQIRFQFYSYFENTPVILGHNYDDVSENIISNLKRNIHYENLQGMTSQCVESGVCLLRPFITIPKEDIIKFADMNNIPHLIDSTPPWSERGKMRDSLLPLIDKFDDRIIPGLHKFASYTKFLHAQWEHFFETWLHTSINANQTLAQGFVIPRDKFFETNYKQQHFWVKIWFHFKFPYRPSNRCFANLMKRIEQFEVRSLKISMIKTINCIITKDTITFNE